MVYVLFVDLQIGNLLINTWYNDCIIINTREKDKDRYIMIRNS